MLKLGCLFSGAGTWELAAENHGIKAVWASEIEPFPIAVTTKNLPDMKHLGDVRNVKGNEIEPVDILAFSSPCQDISLAGGRKGLAGKESGLFHEAIRVIKEMREETNGKYPRILIWENVPGAFSSNQRKDFRTVLEELCRIKDSEAAIPQPDKKWNKAGSIMGDDYSIAWRQLDAQFFGVPQRRKRIFIVCDLNGQCASEILFECQSLQGNSQQSGEEGKDTSKGSGRSIDSADTEIGRLVFENHSNDCRYTGPLDVCQTLSSRLGTGGNNQPLVVETEIPRGGSLISEIYTSSKQSFHVDVFNRGFAGTLVASDWKDPPIVYIPKKEGDE